MQKLEFDCFVSMPPQPAITTSQDYMVGAAMGLCGKNFTEHFWHRQFPATPAVELAVWRVINERPLAGFTEKEEGKARAIKDKEIVSRFGEKVVTPFQAMPFILGQHREASGFFVFFQPTTRGQLLSIEAHWRSSFESFEVGAEEFSQRRVEEDLVIVLR